MLWMRFSRVVRASDNAVVATVLGSIQATSDTVISEGWQMKALNTVHKETKKSSLKMNMLYDQPLWLNMSYRGFFWFIVQSGGGGGGTWMHSAVMTPIALQWVYANSAYLRWREPTGAFSEKPLPPACSAGFWPHWAACSLLEGHPSTGDAGFIDVQTLPKVEMASTFVHHLWIVFSPGSVFPRAFRTMR